MLVQVSYEWRLFKRHLKFETFYRMTVFGIQFIRTTSQSTFIHQMREAYTSTLSTKIFAMKK